METQDMKEKLHVILCGPLPRIEKALLERGDVKIVREDDDLNLLIGMRKDVFGCDMMLVEAPYGHGLYGLTYPVGGHRTCPVWMVAEPPDEVVWKEINIQLDDLHAKKEAAREGAAAVGTPKNEILILADTPQRRSGLSGWIREIYA